jgi:hypothetical protein
VLAAVARVGIRYGLQNACDDTINNVLANSYNNEGKPLGLPLGLLALDADFAVIVKAWPTLPAAMKAGIVAMIRATGMNDARQPRSSSNS